MATKMQKLGMDAELDEILHDFPPGPLDQYRRQASFDWKQMKIFIEGEEAIRKKHIIYETLKHDPLFYNGLTTLSLEQQRILTYQRWKRINEYEFIDPFDLGDITLTEVLTEFDESLGAKFALNGTVFKLTLQSLGTERHQHLVNMVDKKAIFGCFCITEISHGSNANAIQARATYEVASKQFILHTPSIEATKLWIGNLGQMATHASMYLRVITHDSNGAELDNGMHCFAVPIRDPATLMPYPGVTVGDMGEKCGWNGLDNGWVRFEHYAIPRECLLNRSVDVNEKGEFIRKKTGGAENFGPLSAGRVGIISKGATGCKLAAAIVGRYSAIRRQFGDGAVENAVIEYPTQQFRVFPIIAGAYLFTHFHRQVHNWFVDTTIRRMGGEQSEELSEASREVHAISSVGKPIATWFGFRAIQEAREACGGHGYLKSTHLGDLRNNFDPGQTFEGENNMIIQQGANYLLSRYAERLKENRPITSPLETVDFIEKELSMKNRTYQYNHCIIQTCLDAYSFLVTKLLVDTYASIHHKKKQGMTAFEARNESQLFHAHTLAIAYAERTIINEYSKLLDETPIELKAPLQRLCALFATTQLWKFVGSLYMLGYSNGPEFGRRLQQSMTELCSQLKPDAVALVDAIAVPDHILQSTLGASDGQAYKRLFQSMITSPGAMERPPFYQDFVNYLQENRAKL